MLLAQIKTDLTKIENQCGYYAKKDRVVEVREKVDRVAEEVNIHADSCPDAVIDRISQRLSDLGLLEYKKTLERISTIEGFIANFKLGSLLTGGAGLLALVIWLIKYIITRDPSV